MSLEDGRGNTKMQTEGTKVTNPSLKSQVGIIWNVKNQNKHIM